MVSRRQCCLGFCAILLPFAGGCDRPNQTSQTPRTKDSQPPPTLEKPVDPLTSSPTTTTKIEVALLAGGCFWGMEDLIRKIPGVVATQVGYTGGASAAPNYNAVKTGTTGHAESIQVTFDPAQLSYSDLLEKWFFRMHDPTTKDRQGNDRGSQYRSAIFYLSDEQKTTAELVIKKVDKSGVWSDPIVTQVVAAGPFTPAEDYHQDYLEKHPGGYTCHYMREAPVY